MNLEFKELLDLNKDAAKAWLSKFDTIFTDCDGVLWHDDTPIAGAAAVINRLQQLGKQIFFVTNNGTKTREGIWQRAHKMQFNIHVEQIIAPAYSIAEYLQRWPVQKQVYLIGSAALSEELAHVGVAHNACGPDVIPDKLMAYIDQQVRTQVSADYAAVIVGFDEHFSYGKMMKAANILGQNPECLFLATNADTVHRYPQYCIPDTGAIVSAIETCTARRAIIMGKPNPLIVEHLLASGRVKRERTLMIGDSLKVDVPFGLACGFDNLLVGNAHLSYRSVDANAMRNTVYHLDTLGALLTLLE